MNSCQCISCKTGQKLIHILVDLPFSVNAADTIMIVLFEAVVVAVTLASTLGTWRIHQRSAWETMSLTHLLAQQSG